MDLTREKHITERDELLSFFERYLPILALMFSGVIAANSSRPLFSFGFCVCFIVINLTLSRLQHNSSFTQSSIMEFLKFSLTIFGVFYASMYVMDKTPFFLLFFVYTFRVVFSYQTNLRKILGVLTLSLTVFLIQLKTGETFQAAIIMPGVLIGVFFLVLRLLEFLEIKSKELEAAVKDAQRSSNAKSLFLAKMSHEIRTPMNGIIGVSSLLSDTHLNNNQKEMLQILMKSSNALMNVLQDILDFSKFGTENFKINLAPFALEDCLREVVGLFSASAHQENLQLRFRVGAGAPKFLLGDAHRIQQVLTNLISNAIKFTEDGTIEIKADGKVLDDNLYEVAFSVNDTGIGISKENQKILFDAFQQVDEGRNRKYEGAGLGLSICHKLVNLMNGEISVESIQGVGSSFKFILPLKSFGEETTEESSFKASNDPTDALEQEVTENLKILIVEDNKTNQKIIKRMCEIMGHKCEIAEHGRQALEALEENRERPYDVILMDLRMPVMDGISATKEIISKYGNERPKIFAITANAYQEDKEDCLKAGMDDYLSKPFRKSDLFSLLKSVKNKKAS